MKKTEKRKIGRDLTVHRLGICLGLFAAVWILLMVRLADLQLVQGKELAAAARSQYEVKVEGLDTRGAVLDRNLVPLTGGTKQYCYFIRKDRKDPEMEKLLDAVSARNVSGEGSGYSVYRTAIFDEGVNRRLKEEYGAYVLCTGSRYSDSQTACHLIGYLNESEKRGVSGLEKAFEEVLKAGDGQLSLWADGGGSLLLNIPPKYSGGGSPRENTVITSLDGQIQRCCEEAVKASGSEAGGFKGAVLVSDAASGQILAWVSAPAFNPNEVAECLEQGDDCLVNKCIQGTYAPGSVFKVVVAAAALEGGLDEAEDVYLCEGSTEVGGIRLGCQAGPEGGHGEVNMEKAMAVSCNCYFAELGEKIGRESILKMAEKLGFGRKVLGIFEEEEDGNLPKAENTGDWDISNLSIGQGTLLATPLQVHRMMSTAACGGREIPLVLQPAGEGALQNSGSEVLSEKTAAALSLMLEKVMTEGTGRGNGLDFPVYGKTGTAEAVCGGMPLNRCWFSGWCDAGGRRFVVTVLAEEGRSGTASALPVFCKIAEYLKVRGPQLSFR